VWAALTTPELVKQWFFGVETESEWTPGSPIVSRSEWQGESRVDKGVILAFEPPHLFVHALERSILIPANAGTTENAKTKMQIPLRMPSRLRTSPPLPRVGSQHMPVASGIDPPELLSER
jgi:hypothetical protein